MLGGSKGNVVIHTVALIDIFYKIDLTATTMTMAENSSGKSTPLERMKENRTDLHFLKETQLGVA